MKPWGLWAAKMQSFWWDFDAAVENYRFHAKEHDGEYNGEFYARLRVRGTELNFEEFKPVLEECSGEESQAGSHRNQNEKAMHILHRLFDFYGMIVRLLPSAYHSR